MRRKLVWLHRYVGLGMAGFLILAGLTGSLLVWYHELDAAVNPGLLRVEAPADAVPRAPLALRQAVEDAIPGVRANYLTLRPSPPGEAAVFYVEHADAVAATFDEVFVNPYSGEILGTRMWGDITQGWTNLMPFIYRLHYQLALGTIGTWTFGIIALLWTVDCLVGACLTFPRRHHRNGSDKTKAGWLKRWWPAWKVRWRGGTYKLNFDLHQAGGLWPWAMLFVLAWSGVAFNLYDEVYRPVTNTLFGMQADPYQILPALEKKAPEPAIGWTPGLAVAKRHLAELAEAKGITVIHDDRFSYHPDKGYFRLVAKTDRDVSARYGETAVFIDARSGALLASYIPTGEAAGDTLTRWLYSLHMATVWGLPFRLLVTLMGLVVALLSVTGAIIWWRKRKARLASRARSRGGAAGAGNLVTGG